MVIAASEMARNGDSLERIIARLEQFKRNQGLFFTLGSLDYLIKGGRIGKARGFIGKLFGFKPVLSLMNGEVIPIAKARSEDKVLEKILMLLPRGDQKVHWAVAHAACASKLDGITGTLKDRFGAKEVLTGEIGPTVGTHAGPGTWGVFYMKG